MPADVLSQQLQSSLSGAYRVERELGGGGMSRVFLARDEALKREVVLKVIAPDLASGVSLDRFRREIEVAARLQHPSIVPLLSAGEAAGLPYYTMPYVEGESLRARLSRTGELPVREAVAILRDVARALSYAHAHGVVHRDIKPDNVLLSGDYATVADFGVAKAIDAARSRADNDTTLTALGMALGTPAYMSPEQSAGDPTTDHRTDVYAFGVMAYEMLAGEPPFRARSAQALIAAHATQKPPALEEKRPALPRPLSSLVMRCLEKRPADRPQTADEIVSALDAASTPVEMQGASSTRSRRRPMWITAAVVLLLAAAASWYVLRRGSAPPQLNANIIAIIPFRVTSGNAEIKSLREGVLDLVAAKLTGGVRAADTRTALAAWRRAGGSETNDLDESRAIAAMRPLGAGRLVQGEILDASGVLTMHATLLDIGNAARRVEASVSGEPKAVASLIDTLMAKLLVKDVGATDDAASRLARFSFPALQSYVEGQRYMRAGLYDKATEAFARAIQIDSTFALAGLHLAEASGWSLDRRGLIGAQIARAHQDQLGTADRLILEDVAPEGVGGCAAKLKQEERATQIAPESPGVWYRLADNLTHCGREMGLSDWVPRALAGFNRALALDSSYAEAREHIPTLYALLGDTATALRTLKQLIPDTSDYYALNQIFVFADRRSVGQGVNSIARRPVAQSAAFALAFVSFRELAYNDFADTLLAAAERRAATAADRSAIDEQALLIALAQGRPKHAATIAERLHSPARVMLAGLLEDGDSASLLRLLPVLESTAWGPVPEDATAAADWAESVYARAEYDLAAGRMTPLAGALIQKLRRFTSGNVVLQSRVNRLGLILDAQAAVVGKRSDAHALVAEADSILREGIGPAFNQSSGNLIVARLWERLGDLPRAYAATKRTYFGTRSLLYPVAYARDRGRLAAATGNNEDALQSYRHYVRVRANAEPSLAADVESARKEIARLEKLTGGR